MLVRWAPTLQWMVCSIASHTLNSFSRNLAISARTFKVRCNHLLLSTLFTNFVLVTISLSTNSYAHVLSIDLANMLCCFHDHNCGTAKSSDKQNEAVCSLSLKLEGCFTWDIINITIIIIIIKNLILTSLSQLGAIYFYSSKYSWVIFLTCH